MTGMKKGVKGVWDKYKYAALVILIGVGLMLWPVSGRTSGTSGSRTAVSGADSANSANPAGSAGPGSPDNRNRPETRDIQREMEEALGHISGVGRVRVLLTEENDGERRLAEDISESTRKGESGTEESSKNSGTVLIDTGSGTDGVIITQTRRPVYRGALIVCEGGDRAPVRLAVTRAVSALTGLSAGRIAVEKWA